MPSICDSLSPEHTRRAICPPLFMSPISGSHTPSLPPPPSPSLNMSLSRLCSCGASNSMCREADILDTASLACHSTCYWSLCTCYRSLLTCYRSFLTCHRSLLTYHGSLVIYSPVALLLESEACAHSSLCCKRHVLYDRSCSLSIRAHPSYLLEN